MLSATSCTVLWCLASIVAVLALAAFWRAYATTHLRIRAHEIELEWRFESLARSLIAGVEIQLRAQANVDGPFASILRRRLDRPVHDWVDLTSMVDRSLATAPLAREEYAGFDLEALVAGLARQEPVFAAGEEKVAILVIRARLRLPATRRTRASRELEVVRSIRVSRTTVEPELRRFGLFIGKADGLTDLGRANALREELCRRTASSRKLSASLLCSWLPCVRHMSAGVLHGRPRRPLILALRPGPAPGRAITIAKAAPRPWSGRPRFLAWSH